MNTLERNPSQPVFDDLEFEFALTPGVKFNAEVAQELAEQVAQHDGGRRNHSHASSFGKVRVGIEGLSEDLADEDRDTKNLLLPADALSYDPNTVFARQFQNALDEREHSNRMSIKGEIGLFAMLSAIPAGFSALVLSYDGLTAKEALASAGIGLTFGALLSGYQGSRNIYRRVVTDQGNRRIHETRLERAGRLAGNLALPSVFEKTSNR